MQSQFNVNVNLNPVVIDGDVNRPPYQVIDLIELSVSMGIKGCYRFVVSLDNDSRKALKARDFTTFKRRYHYQLITGDNCDVVSEGLIHRCVSFESINQRRVVRLHNLQTIVNELMHEAIGSMVLSNITQYDSSSHEMRFFDIARMLTPYTSGTGKSGPINSPRFQMDVKSDVANLFGRRRFSIERNRIGDTDITGVFTTWTCGEPGLEKAKIMLHDQALGNRPEPEDDSFKMKTELAPLPEPTPITCTPMPVATVLEQFKKVIVPVIE